MPIKLTKVTVNSSNEEDLLKKKESTEFYTGFITGVFAGAVGTIIALFG